MKGHKGWSYAPYKPLLWESGDVYVCRICPSEDKIHMEWLGDGSAEIYFRKRGEGEFALAGKSENNEFDILNLECDTDYEFYVKRGAEKSRVRLARCGKCVGTVVNYLHPDDKAYAFSGNYLCSPSLVRHPEGYLLASMDLFAGGAPQNLTLIFRSDDDGETWHYVSELMPCFWGKMFIHKGELYMLSCSTEYGDLLIGKSTDGGKTFSDPVCLLRGSGGRLRNYGEDRRNAGVHKNPQNVVHYKGRIYETLEWGPGLDNGYCYAAMVMSADENADLLDPESWSFTEPTRFDPGFAPEFAHIPENVHILEGTLAVNHEGELINIMRIHGDLGKMLAYRVDVENPDAPLEYYDSVDIWAYPSKFMVKYDDVSEKYYTIACGIRNGKIEHARYLLSLFSSKNLKTWELEREIYDYSDEDPQRVGFQYVDFEFDGDDIIFLCRTAMNKAANFHDSNYSTFDRIKNFRK